MLLFPDFVIPADGGSCELKGPGPHLTVLTSRGVGYRHLVNTKLISWQNKFSPHDNSESTVPSFEHSLELRFLFLHLFSNFFLVSLWPRCRNGITDALVVLSSEH